MKRTDFSATKSIQTNKKLLILILLYLVKKGTPTLGDQSPTGGWFRVLRPFATSPVLAEGSGIEPRHGDAPTPKREPFQQSNPAQAQCEVDMTPFWKSPQVTEDKINWVLTLYERSPRRSPANRCSQVNNNHNRLIPNKSTLVYRRALVTSAASEKPTTTQKQNSGCVDTQPQAQATTSTRNHNHTQHTTTYTHKTKTTGCLGGGCEAPHGHTQKNTAARQSGNNATR